MKEHNDPPAFVLFGIPFHDVTFDEAVAWAVTRMKAGRPSYIATANVDFIMQAWRDPELQRILLEADLVIADGAPIVWASRFFGPKLRERVTGSDITPMLASACAKENLRVFLLGGAPGVAEKAADVLWGKNPSLAIAGCHSPPPASVLEMDHAAITERLNDAKPDLLLVAFGAPKQEKFINMNLRNWTVPLSIGIGGTLDFLAGVQRRAPAPVQKIHMEWLWRMLTNPKRLFRRYSNNIAFLFSTLLRLRLLRGDHHHRPRIRDGNANLPDANFEALHTRALDLHELGRLSECVREHRHILINLRGCAWLDSSELGQILTAARALKRFKRRVLLAFPAPNLAAFLRECRLDAYLEVLADGTSAIERLTKWQQESRSGEITNSRGILKLRLPDELTAASVASWTGRIGANPLDGIARVEIDASALEYLDSAGVGWLVALRRKCDQRTIRMPCTGFQGRPLQTLRIAKLDGVFAAA